jgi:hypothetical protein
MWSGLSQKCDFRRQTMNFGVLAAYKDRVCA